MTALPESSSRAVRVETGDATPVPAPGEGVDRCLCFDVRFERILDIIDKTGGGLHEAHRRTGCGARCGLCLPYIQVMLKTRRTTLPVMWADDFEALGVNPGRIQQIQQSLLETHTKSCPASNAARPADHKASW